MKSVEKSWRFSLDKSSSLLLPTSLFEAMEMTRWKLLLPSFSRFSDIWCSWEASCVSSGRKIHQIDINKSFFRFSFLLKDFWSVFPFFSYDKTILKHIWLIHPKLMRLSRSFSSVRDMLKEVFLLAARVQLKRNLKLAPEIFGKFFAPIHL